MGDGEPEADPTGSTVAETLERLEDAFPVVRWDARSPVDDSDLHLLGAFRRLDPHTRAIGAEPHRVVDDVGNRPLE